MDNLKKNILQSIRGSGYYVMVYTKIYLNKSNGIYSRLERLKDATDSYENYKKHRRNMTKYLKLKDLRKRYGC